MLLVHILVKKIFDGNRYPIM